MDRNKLYINGTWRDTGTHLTVVDPGNGEAFAEIAQADATMAREAVDAAWNSWAGWRSLTARDRADYLLDAAARMAARREEIGTIVVRENGKPLAQGIGEVDVAVDHLRWFAEEARRAYGRIVPNQVAGKRHFVIRQPVGPVVAIAPWNFPLMLAVRKVAPAMAAGCTVILRPASKTPLSAVAFAECMEAAGIPAGAFQLISGSARELTAVFMEDPRIRKISFTGSTEVGKQLLAQSAATVTKLSLELGGHAPAIVFGDADLDTAVAGTLGAKFRNTGQSCIAANRIFVERSVADAFTEKFVAATRAMKVGHGLEEGVEIGAIADEAGMKTALAHIENAVKSGARVATGGKPLDHGTGLFLEPTVLVDVPDSALCMREETFAPIAPITIFDTEEEAIERANATEYGLAAYLYTENLGRGLRVAEALEAGTVGLNDAVPSTSIAPFGGMKQSGLGRELGTEGLDSFLETKHISIGGVDG